MKRTSIGGGFAVATLALVMAGCSTTQQVKVADNPSSYCPFLGRDVCAKLTPTATPSAFSGDAMGTSNNAVAALRYVNPDARWTQYKKVMIAPVGFWGGDDTSVSKEDQIALTNYFTQALNTALSKKFPVVQQPGPDVMEIAIAIDEIGKATPVLRTVSMVIPQTRVLSTLKYAQLVWRGSAQARIDPDRTPQERTKLIRDAVHQMLKRFPPER